MPPFTSWFRGRDAISWLIGNECPGGSHDMPMVATSANGQPAYGLYLRTPAGDFAPFQLQVLELDGDLVRHVTVVLRHLAVRDLRAARGPARRPDVTRTPGTTLVGSVDLLGRSLDYTRDRLATVRGGLLDRQTPCADWRLAQLLVHMEDSLDAFTEAAGGAVGGAPEHHGRRAGRGDPGEGLRAARRVEPDRSGRRPGRRARPRELAARRDRRPRDHHPRMGRRPDHGRPGADPRRARARPAAGRPCGGDRGRPRRPVRTGRRRSHPDAPYDVELLAFLGRT